MYVRNSIVVFVICCNSIVISMTALQRLAMTGIQTHIESPLEHIRHVGMVVGECVMNSFNLSDEKHKLKFDYPTTQDIESIKALSRPIAIQEKELKRIGTDTIPGPMQQTLEVKSTQQQQGGFSNTERFGEGMVNATECSDTDRYIHTLSCTHTHNSSHLLLPSDLYYDHKD